MATDRAGVSPTRFDVLFAVMHSSDGEYWHVLEDEDTDRVVPAIYLHEAEADARCDDMAAAFPDHHYKVVEGIVHG